MPPPTYYPPPPQPVYYDPTYFGRDYTARLSELTFNSRPIIQSLSLIAQEYTRYASTVIHCIESHIRRAPNHAKLPAFYLLDAISKNVFEPYARLFIPVVARLFIDTYELVDQNTRSKMEEMLLTWRTAAPNGRELFGVVTQLAIERHIWGGESTQSGSMSGSGQPGISTQQVLSELEFVLNQKERAVQANPYDRQSQTHVAVLQQLRKLVQAGVSQAELGQILGQLRTLAAPAPPVAPVPPVNPVSHQYPPQPSYPPVAGPSYALPQVPYAPPQASYPPPSSFSHAKAEPVEIPNLLSSQSISGTSSTSATPAVPVNVSSLFSALVKAGVVSASSTPTGAGATAKPEGTPPADLTQDAAREYRKKILSTGIKLSSAGILKQQPPIVQFLHDRLPSQCKQCGIRFAGDSTGKKKLQDHLDMHFRQNRKASQAAGRGYSRSWFITIDDWLHDGAVDVKGKSRADGSRMNAKAVAAAEAAKHDAELRAMFVVVPPGDEAKSIACPICKETLKSEFLEDDEEWVWRNAVKKDDRIYHATCHAEAAASKSNLVSRLRNEISSRSRSRTPETLRTPPRVQAQLNEDVKLGLSSPSKLIGTKRKAEEENPTSTHEEQLTPPTKKVALSAS
ncbi:hypothetical protein EW026_g162 [Hermanssonia centrifuga]|uniref:CID domain-containing protein n=1 Tax=Hermanssonia centrifuga TaxID=98765 RepID=A0A4S4KWG8_9APHY|nr:hypothetical protein EW026_g162 [Hermanssonia centrifuga]